MCNIPQGISNRDLMVRLNPNCARGADSAVGFSNSSLKKWVRALIFFNLFRDVHICRYKDYFIQYLDKIFTNKIL